nr:hypothetical protein [Candidatus Arsenophonus triatominarum]
MTTISRWLKSRCFRPKDLWRLVETSIDKKSPCVLIADDTLIAKTRSKKIEMVHYQSRVSHRHIKFQKWLKSKG